MKTFWCLLIVLMIAATSPAQGDRRDPYGPQGRQDRASDWDWDRDRDPRGSSVIWLIRRAERESNAFRAWFERNYKRRSLGRSRDNRWLKREIQSLDEAMERVRKFVGERRADKARQNFEDAMDHERNIDLEITDRRSPTARAVAPEWLDLRLTLERLEFVYRLRHG